MKWTSYVKIGVGYIALFILYDYLFAKFLPHARIWFKVAGAALLMMLPAAVFYGLRFSIGEVILIRRSHHPRLVDGKRVAVLGSLRPFAEPIQTPFSNQDCLAYSYSVYSWKTDPKSKQRLQIFAYSGQAMTRSVIRSTAGDLKLLGFVDGTESKEYQGSDLEVRQNAENYISSTSFTYMERLDLKTKLNQFKDLMMESNGYLKQDWKMTKEEVSLDNLLLSETWLKLADQYCVIGVFNAAKMGLYGEPWRSGAITVLEGNQKEAQTTMIGKIIWAVIMGTFLLIFVNFFLYGFLH